MKYHHPLNQILAQTRSYWDRDEIRPAVRQAFRRGLECRTEALGAEVYSSENRELILYHTCKSRACPSCGYRASVQWLRERWAALPDVLYKGITFTMPNLLWPFFHDNPRLANALPAIAAEVIRAQVGVRHGLRLGVIAIPHTFNGRLEFNSHVHTMVTEGGLNESSDIWVSRVYCDRDGLMKAWRKAVIALLRVALRAGLFGPELTTDQMDDLLTHLEKCWWSIKIQSFEDKWHFLQYAGRYVRRPQLPSVVSLGLGNELSGFGTKIRNCDAASRWSAQSRSLLTVGFSTFRIAISTLFGTSGCLLRVRSGKLRQLSLSSSDRSEGHTPDLAPGRTP